MNPMIISHHAERSAPTLLVPTGADMAVRRAEQLLVKPMLAGEYAVMAQVGPYNYPLHTDTLQKAIRFAEQNAARFQLPLIAPALRGPSIMAIEHRHLDVLGTWVKYSRRLHMLGDAGRAYRMLSGEFYTEGDRAVKREGNRRISLSFSLNDSTIEAESAWDVLIYRLRFRGQVPSNPRMGIPYDTCPCCLSRFVLILDNGNRHCQECSYADT